MRCILASGHGENIDELLYMSNEFPKPTRKKGEVLIEVHSCALAPGDVRVLAGHCDYFQEPRGFPYIPGGDISGTVVEADSNSRFKAGDKVMAEFELPRPLDGLAEYVSVKENLVELAPNSVPLMLASTLPSSAMSAMVAAKKYVKPGYRVLILGGGGGVGTFFLQLAKKYGAGYICTTFSSRDKEWLMPALGVDKVINYQEENWWENKELLWRGPFDVIVDLAVGREAWRKARSSKLLSRHGRFLAFTSDKPLLEIHNFRQTITSIGPMMFRGLWTRLCPFVPTYTCLGDWLEPKPGRLAEVAKLVDDGMVIVLDPVSPLSFTEEDVKRGFDIMKQRRARGKVVISIKE
jgi:NADPH:quinone reductase-like Zn-dependent oxidoreductase